MGAADEGDGRGGGNTGPEAGTPRATDETGLIRRPRREGVKGSRPRVHIPGYAPGCWGYAPGWVKPGCWGYAPG